MTTAYPPELPPIACPGDQRCPPPYPPELPPIVCPGDARCPVAPPMNMETVPTLNEWGLIGLIVVMLIAAAANFAGRGNDASG